MEVLLIVNNIMYINWPTGRGDIEIIIKSYNLLNKIYFYYMTKSSTEIPGNKFNTLSFMPIYGHLL